MIFPEGLAKRVVASTIPDFKMAPSSWPEEVDVFTVPHIRMKQLVGEASEKVCILIL